MGFRCWLFGHKPPPEVELEFPNYTKVPSNIVGNQNPNSTFADDYVFPNSLGIKNLQEEEYSGVTITTVHSGASFKSGIMFFLHAGRFAIVMKPCMRCGIYFEKHKPDKSQMEDDYYLNFDLARTKKIIDG